MKGKETFEELYLTLKNSQNEEEVILGIKNILKHCLKEEYDVELLSNPYFKSLLPEIRDNVCDEMDSIRHALTKEIKEIDSELNNIINESGFSEQINKLKDLKRDCVSLVFEIDERKKDLKSLI